MSLRRSTRYFTIRRAGIQSGLLRPALALLLSLTVLAAGCSKKSRGPGGPVLTVEDVRQPEGDVGATAMTFTLTLSQAQPLPVTVTCATANDTALAGSDYTAVAANITIPAGATTATFTVSLTGDTVDEADETFFVNLSNPVNIALGATQALGTIATDEWRRSATNQLVIPPLTPTTIQWSVADPCVLHDPADGKWKLWFSASTEDRTTHASFVQIYYAESADGLTFPTAPTLAYSTAVSATAWDYTHVETPSVVKNPDPSAPLNEKWLLFYSGANTTTQAAAGRPTTTTYYQIGLAYSADGKTFTRRATGLHGLPGLVLEATAPLFGASLPGTYFDGLLADPDAIVKDGEVQLWFSSYAEDAARSPLAFGVSHAVSSDSGVTWTSGHDNPLISLRKPAELGSGQQPSVLWNSADNRYEMWFTNDTAAEKALVPATYFSAYSFWHATSADGITWAPEYTRPDFDWQPAHAYESLGLVTGVEVVLDAGVYRAYYPAWGTANIPDSTIYLCPVNNGPPSLVPGIVTLNLALRN